MGRRTSYTLADGRTVPALLKYQVENVIEKLDRAGELPEHAGVSVRAISAVMKAVASFDYEGLGAAASQRAIARRSRYSERHVREVLRFAVDVGFLERHPRWAAAARTPSGALEPVTDDRATVYVVHLVPREMARGARTSCCSISRRLPILRGSPACENVSSARWRSTRSPSAR